MEMCYDGALVMPSSYAIMEEEEMTYVEGGAHKMTKKECIKGLALAGINSASLVIAASVSFLTAKMIINKVAKLSGLAANVVSAVLGWAASQVVNLAVAVARGALNNGVSIYWNWNILKRPIGVGYTVL